MTSLKGASFFLRITLLLAGMLAASSLSIKFAIALPPPGVQLSKDIKPGAILAPSFILMDVDSGRILSQRDANRRMAPASTTKTMTALLAISEGDLDKVYRIGPNPPRVGESSIGLLQGEQLTLAELVKAAMIQSANDSCLAIAEAVAGSEAAFVKRMNEKAREVGATHTHFVNPHGLNDPNHYTTAHDLALIARAALKLPFFNEVISTQTTDISGNWKTGGPRRLHNKNRLLFRWSECDGVKTGYTRQAGRCLIASATRINPMTRKPWRLLSVVLHSPDSWGDSYRLMEKEGFSKYRPVTVAEADTEAGTFKVGGGAFDGEAIVKKAAILPLTNLEERLLTHHTQFFKVTAPVAAGRIVGSWQFDINGQKIAEVPLFSREDVPASTIARILPGASTVLPSNPGLRIGTFGAILLGFALLLAAFKAGANGRHKSPRPR